MQDKIFEQTDEIILLLDGVILNKYDLMKKYNADSWMSTILSMRKNDSEWFKELRGAFAGAIFDKNLNKWTCFTDQCGAHLVLTYVDKEKIAIGTQTNYFSDWMKLNGIERIVDNEWKQDMIWYGNTREVYSILSGVHRIFPGHYFIFDIDNGAAFEKILYGN